MLGKVTWHQFPPHPLVADVRLEGAGEDRAGTIGTRQHLDDSHVNTHVVDASHRSAVEAVEDRLFVDLVSNGLESAKRSYRPFP